MQILLLSKVKEKKTLIPGKTFLLISFIDQMLLHMHMVRNIDKTYEVSCRSQDSQI